MRSRRLLRVDGKEARALTASPGWVSQRIERLQGSLSKCERAEWEI